MNDNEHDGELIKMSELARRAGVARGTIQHYLREGLLPRPVKTFRNMAYYDAGCVDRIRMIKDLQARRHLPLAVIREMIAPDGADDAWARTLVEAQQAAVDGVAAPARDASLGRRAAAKAFGLKQRHVAELEEMGLISTRKVGGKQVFTGADLEVLAAIANLERSGCSQSAGFSVGDLVMYKDALDELLVKEVETFVRAISAVSGKDEAPELARSAVQGATGLLLALRRKLLMDMLESP